MKKLREGGNGEFEFIQLDPSKYESIEALLREVYEADGWSAATESEYSEQIASAEVSDTPVVEEENKTEAASEQEIASEETASEEAPVAE